MSSQSAVPGAASPNDAREMRELLQAAATASERAHSPYSKIRVGAALLGADGRTYTGCNVENASFGLTICAERAAAVQAVSAGVRSFRALAIATSLAEPMLPCGACRQFLVEFGSDLRIVMQGANGARSEARLAELLPRAFGPDALA
jgi:cytidine deaminase